MRIEPDDGDTLRSARMAGDLRPRDESALLYRLTDSVAGADTLEEAYERALDAVEWALEADRSSILLFDADDVVRFKAWRGLSDAYRRAVEGHSPWARTDPGPRPIFIGDVDGDPSMEPYREVFRAESIRAIAFVPLVYRQTLLGKFMLYYAEPRAFTGEQVRLAETVAEQISQSVARKSAELEIKRLYQEAERSRKAAEDLARSREDLVAIVSHDLRNPLAAIMTSASYLLRLSDMDPSGRLRRHADTIRRASYRMERLIRDLLDFAAIDAGALTVTTEPVEVAWLLEQVRELEPLALERGLRLEIDVPAERLVVRCERDRVQQVFSNLVGNAVRHTPTGGHIRVRTEALEGWVELSVSDTGAGIPDEQLPKLFQRFWCGRRSDQGGVGLGLSIARGIVEAHGGTIRAGNRPEGGAVFSFTLPRPAV